MSVIPFSRELFDRLVCPVSRAPLKYVDDRLVSTDPETRRAYPVRDGIPVMLVPDSTVLDPDTWRDLQAGPGPLSGGGR